MVAVIQTPRVVLSCNEKISNIVHRGTICDVFTPMPLRWVRLKVFDGDGICIQNTTRGLWPLLHLPKRGSDVLSCRQLVNIS